MSGQLIEPIRRQMRRSARQQLPQQTANGILLAGMIPIATAPRKLRSQSLTAVNRQRIVNRDSWIDRSQQPRVDHLDSSGWTKQHIPQPQVAMQRPDLLQLGEGFQQLAGDLLNHIGRKSSPPDQQSSSDSPIGNGLTAISDRSSLSTS